MTTYSGFFFSSSSSESEKSAFADFPLVEDSLAFFPPFPPLPPLSEPWDDLSESLAAKFKKTKLFL